MIQVWPATDWQNHNKMWYLCNKRQQPRKQEQFYKELQNVLHTACGAWVFRIIKNKVWTKLLQREAICIKIPSCGHHSWAMYATEQATVLCFLPHAPPPAPPHTLFISTYLYLKRSFCTISFILSTCSRLAGTFSVKSTFRLSSAYGRKIMWKPIQERESREQLCTTMASKQ